MTSSADVASRTLARDGSDTTTAAAIGRKTSASGSSRPDPVRRGTYVDHVWVNQTDTASTPAYPARTNARHRAASVRRSEVTESAPATSAIKMSAAAAACHCQLSPRKPRSEETRAIVAVDGGPPRRNAPALRDWNTQVGSVPWTIS